jgi:hypothetical protein
MNQIHPVHGSVVEPLGSVGTLTVLVIGIAFMLPLVVLVWQLQFFHIMLGMNLQPKHTSLRF